MNFQLLDIQNDLRLFIERGLLAEHEAAQVVGVVGEEFPFAAAMDNAESVRVHINVEDVQQFPGEDALRRTCREVTGDDRERKFTFVSGLNVVFAIKPIAQDELIDGAATKSKPYVDYLGVDLRDESVDMKKSFDAIPGMAKAAGWRHVVHRAGRVRCCHTEVGSKHWVYPPEGTTGDRRPIEFTFGEFKMFDTYPGCDYRSIDPAHPLAGHAASVVAEASCDLSVVDIAIAPSMPEAPAKIYVFEERSCNTSPSETLLHVLRSAYQTTEICSYDVAKPAGLLPLPPALFLALETKGFRALPALVVDGQVRTQGWLPHPDEAVQLLERAAEKRLLAREPNTSGACCATRCC